MPAAGEVRVEPEAPWLQQLPHKSESSSGSEDLEVVCVLPPVLVPTRPGDTLVLAVGTALRQVGSHIGIRDLLDPLQVRTPDAQESSSRPLKGVQTSPGALFHLAEAEEEAAARRQSFTRQSSGGHTLGTSSSSSCWGFGELDEEEERRQVPCKNIRELGLPPILARRASFGSFTSFATAPGSAGSFIMEEGGLSAHPSGSALVAPATALVPSQGPSGSVGDLIRHGSGPVVGPLPSSGSVASGWPEKLPDVSTEAGRTSILDFEHLFMQYYVEVQSRWKLRCWVHCALGPWRRLRLLRRSAGAAAGGRGAAAVAAVPVLPTAVEVAEAWKAEVTEYICKHGDACQLRWQGLRLSRKALKRQLDAEVRQQDELSGPRSRVVLTLETERVCHRLLWAIGDAIPPARLLLEMQAVLQARWPHCRVRCADDFFHPSSVFHTVLIFFSVALALSVRVLMLAIQAVIAMQAVPARGIRGYARQAPLEPTREERLDQLAARMLLTGSIAHLWVLHAMAASFPLRSLHSPFRRDLGCLAAYSPTALLLLRTIAPLSALAVPLAMAVRFDRLGLSLIVPAPGRPAGFHTGALLCSATLPLLTGLVAWSVRSSLYSHHHLFIVLLFLAHLGAALGFAAYFEMVKWAVYAASALVMGGLFLYFRYTTEFTSARLLKAAQLQWACAHVVPVLGLLLAAALEVESGVARALVDFICEAQDIIPTKMCIRLLREADR